MTHGASADSCRTMDICIFSQRVVVACIAEVAAFSDKLKFIGRTVRIVACNAFPVLYGFMRIFFFREFLVTGITDIHDVLDLSELVPFRLLQVVFGCAMAYYTFPGTYGAVSILVLLDIGMALRRYA